MHVDLVDVDLVAKGVEKVEGRRVNPNTLQTHRAVKLEQVVVLWIGMLKVSLSALVINVANCKIITRILLKYLQKAGSIFPTLNLYLSQFFVRFCLKT